MVVGAVIREFFYVHSGHAYGCKFKSAVFVACLEYQVSIVFVFYFVVSDVIGLYVCYPIVVSVVLVYV